MTFFHFYRYGNIDCDITFKNQTTDTIQVLVYCTYNGGLTINDRLEVKLLET